jgi:hypothetical protein
MVTPQRLEMWREGTALLLPELESSWGPLYMDRDSRVIAQSSATFPNSTEIRSQLWSEHALRYIEAVMDRLRRFADHSYCPSRAAKLLDF